MQGGPHQTSPRRRRRSPAQPFSLPFFPSHFCSGGGSGGCAATRTMGSQMVSMTMPARGGPVSCVQSREPAPPRATGQWTPLRPCGRIAGITHRNTAVLHPVVAPRLGRPSLAVTVTAESVAGRGPRHVDEVSHHSADACDATNHPSYDEAMAMGCLLNEPPHGPSTPPKGVPRETTRMPASRGIPQPVRVCLSPARADEILG